MTPLVIAHRGASAHAPENTLAAFRLAIDAGADGVEFDVQLSKDGVPVVFHDNSLWRIARRRERVADLNANELCDIDVGAWYDRTRRRSSTKFEGERIPLFTSVLEVAARCEGPIYVELKTDTRKYRELAAAVCDVLRASSLLPRVIVKSFYLEALREVKRFLPEVTTAALFAPQLRKRNFIDAAERCGADQLSLHYSLATAKTCAAAKAAGMPITIWTVDNPRWIERCRTRDIGALITNDPAKMLAARNSLPSE